jgi:hypothetical protein
VHGFEVVGGADRPVSPAAQRIATNWRLVGVGVHLQAVAGPPFWSTPEMTESSALIEATCHTMMEQP